MTNLEALEALQELFSDPSRWTTHYPARDVFGHDVPPNSPSASCWCFIGGADKIAGNDVALYANLLNSLRRVTWSKHCRGMASVNDNLGREAVLAVIAHAIATERAKANWEKL